MQKCGVSCMAEAKQTVQGKQASGNDECIAYGNTSVLRAYLPENGPIQATNMNCIMRRLWGWAWGWGRRDLHIQEGIEEV